MEGGPSIGIPLLYQHVGGDKWRALGLSDDPTWPLGFSQFGDARKGDHLGERIDFDDLPANVRAHVKERLELDHGEAERET